VEAVIEAGIKRVYVGSDDPNPLVAGGGIKILKEHGIEVITNVLKEECDRLNEVFFYFIQTRRPYVAMKYAMTMDGKIATYSGLSKWITGEKAREHVQNLRHRYKAIMAGIGTVLADDPLLTCRIEGGVNPIRVICDTHLKLPLESQIVKTAKEVPTIVAVSERYRETAQSEALPKTEKVSIEEKIGKYEENGIEILYVAEKNGHIDLNNLMQKLGERSIDSILLEGGGILNWSALKSGIVNKVYAYIAPKLFGGANAKTPIEGMGTDSPAHAVMLGNSKVTKLGDDFLIECDVVNT
jgi:diaminohydroxyphosphoribosylaminopyrimidine deaminase/5-amino-6-(5-phosphoribosylamino)uracil reductase